jgi:hypothetical protein
VIGRGLVFLGAVLLLAGCGAHVQSKAFGPPVYEIYRMPEEEVRPLFAGKTVMTFVDFYVDCYNGWSGQYYTPHCNKRPGPGTQIEFLADEGRSYLWFPGNRGLVPGQWVVRRWYEKYEICFRYGSDTRNAITGERGGDVHCTLLSDYAGTVAEVRDGDPFDLASGGLPFVLSRDKTTIDDLLLQINSQTSDRGGGRTGPN